MTRYVHVALAGAAALVLLTGCGLLPGTGEDTKPSSSAAPSKPAPTRPPEPENAIEATPENGQDSLTAKVESFVADGTGFGRLDYELTNVGSEDFQVTSEFADPYNYSVSVQVANVQIIDDQAQEKKYVLNDDARHCLCYWEPPGADYFYLEPEDSETFSNMYLISKEARTVTVIIPGFEPVKNVKVTRP